MPVPRITPWGIADEINEISNGIYFVSSEYFGGLAICLSRSPFLTEACIKRAEPSNVGGFLFFDEEVKSLIPMYELSSLWKTFYPCLRVEKIEKNFLISLSRSCPDYLFDRGIIPLPRMYRQHLLNQEIINLREEKSDNLIIATFLAPQPDWVQVRTAADNYYIVTRSSYQNRTPNLLEYCYVIMALGKHPWRDNRIQPF
ncbi:hypothetical protein FD723_40280 (plasmid) [Nostoc sp. C052]|uniref:hypothetical protein n=1 Tax=Nostoc sp. C052 TaxID=2576902 RepID=UPI0015C2FF2C|nr:hypothetical protein [Nostoc sp. C052]QLE46452.1 hypothetical protein FD723_40280 [Nostoc sp. C052]